MPLIGLTDSVLKRVNWKFGASMAESSHVPRDSTTRNRRETVGARECIGLLTKCRKNFARSLSRLKNVRIGGGFNSPSVSDARLDAVCWSFPFVTVVTPPSLKSGFGRLLIRTLETTSLATVRRTTRGFMSGNRRRETQRFVHLTKSIWPREAQRNFISRTSELLS